MSPVSLDYMFSPSRYLRTYKGILKINPKRMNIKKKLWKRKIKNYSIIHDSYIYFYDINVQKYKHCALTTPCLLLNRGERKYKQIRSTRIRIVHIKEEARKRRSRVCVRLAWTVSVCARNKGRYFLFFPPLLLLLFSFSPFFRNASRRPIGTRLADLSVTRANRFA